MTARYRRPPAGELHRATAAWIDTIRPLPDHLEPIAVLALTLADLIEVDGTAAAADQYRRTLAALVPTDAKQHRSQANTAAILAAGAQAEVRDAEEPEPQNTRRGSRGGRAPSRVRSAPVAKGGDRRRVRDR